MESTGNSQYMLASLYSLRPGDSSSRALNAVPLNVIGGSAEAPLVLDLLNPAVTAFGAGARPLPTRAMPGAELAVSVTAEAMAQNPRLLVLHHLNPMATRAEVVSITRLP